MKVLMIHTHYLQGGGEDTIFREEQQLLRETHDVRILSFHNQPGIRGMIQFGLSIWNVFAAAKIKAAIREFQPDIIHLHNYHFAIGPIAIRVAARAGVPIVVTLHNYRLLCPSATLLYKDELFTDSLHCSFPWKAVRRKVYRNSLLQTFWLAFIIWFHRRIGTWKKVDRYITLTDFARSLFVNSSLSLPPEKFVTKPNFKSAPANDIFQKANHFLFVGRLSAEKGVKVLLETSALAGYELHIAGDGPLKEEVLTSSRQHSHIKFLGNLDKAGVEKAMLSCTALVFPSIWYEGMPMTMLEALATGTPVIASNLGAMASMIRDGYNGLHFKPGNATELAEKLKRWQTMEERERDSFRQNARASYQSQYTPENNKQQLVDIYKKILYAKTVD